MAKTPKNKKTTKKKKPRTALEALDILATDTDFLDLIDENIGLKENDPEEFYRRARIDYRNGGCGMGKI